MIRDAFAEFGIALRQVWSDATSGEWWQRPEGKPPRRMPLWVWPPAVLCAIAVLIAYGRLAGWLDFYGPSVWIALPWDWATNVQIGWSHGLWLMTNTL